MGSRAQVQDFKPVTTFLTISVSTGVKWFKVQQCAGVHWEVLFVALVWATFILMVEIFSLKYVENSLHFVNEEKLLGVMGCGFIRLSIVENSILGLSWFFLMISEKWARLASLIAVL